MATDLRARLADAIQPHLANAGFPYPRDGTARWLADVLLSLSGIAIVELPEPPYTRADVAKLAADLLATANAAGEQ